MRKFTKRYIANIVIETTSPLKVGSSDLDMLQDSPIQKDFNELPMILGSSIAGILRKEFNTHEANDIFGDEYSNKKENRGSRLIVSNALVCDENMQATETLQLHKSDFLKIFDTLPIREHTRISHKGVSDNDNNAKYDEEVVYKGTRFIFRLEFIADENDEHHWLELMHIIHSKIFRLGGGTSKGFGDVKVLDELSTYNLFDVDSDEYRAHSSSLNTMFSKSLPQSNKKDLNYICYTLSIQPEDFFIIGSGFGDDDADIVPMYEQVVDYKIAQLSDEMILIPASSIKGAISHRTTYHFNKSSKLFVGNADAHNTIVEIFGAAKDEEAQSKGKILISDCFKKHSSKTKVFDHVAIDRFTGASIQSALFNEKTVADDGDSYEIEILLHVKVSDVALTAFESALKDITSGMLSLGGATTKGHGIFKGTVLKNGETL